MKSVERVPIITPNNIANVKLRIVSHPNTKMHIKTIAVLNDVLIVRDNVLFRASLMTINLSRFG